MTIFSLISLSIFFVFDQYVKTTEVVSQRIMRNTEINRFFSLIERDVRFALNRAVKGNDGESRGAIVVGSNIQGEFLAVTTSLPDYWQREQSRLVRVSWVLDDGVIYRGTWPVLDRALNSERFRLAVVQGVKDIRLSIKPDLDDPGDESDPDPKAGGIPGSRRLDVRIRLEHGGQGVRVMRLLGDFSRFTAAELVSGSAGIFAFVSFDVSPTVFSDAASKLS